jgi:drug/metabolite transporter (DMT)-like permease
MNWLFFALLAPAIYAIVVSFDKYILERQVKDYRGMPIYGAISGTLFGFLLWVITGFPILDFYNTILIIFTGVLTIFGAATYFKALSNDEASKITILFQFTPVIVLILSYLFLKEGINSVQLMGFLLILFATIGAEFNKKQFKFGLSSSLILILITDFFWALSFVLFKFVVGEYSFSEIVSFEGFGWGIGGVILWLFFPSIRNAFVKTNRAMGKKIVSLVFLNESIFVLAKLCSFYAISLGSVALVEVVAGTQVFFAIFYGWVLTTVAPRIFKEDISRVGLYKKILMGILVLAGLWLIK